MIFAATSGVVDPRRSTEADLYLLRTPEEHVDTGVGDNAIALNRTLADLINLGLVAKQAHWNLVGPGFRPLHLLLDELADIAREGGDSVAERVMALGSHADGTVSTVATSNDLPYPGPGAIHSTDVVRSFDAILGVVTTRLTNTMGILDGDFVSQDLLIGIAGSLEKQAWMIRAYAG
jgi:starvation-inducible DNA-binding protein